MQIKTTMRYVKCIRLEKKADNIDNIKIGAKETRIFMY